MKRRITPEQLNELSDEQKQKLREWWKPERGDHYYDELYNSETCVNDMLYIKEYKRDFLPLLDISKMIEILTESEPYQSNQLWVSYGVINGIPQSCIFDSIKNVEEFWPICDGLNICDALFSAVKQVL